MNLSGLNKDILAHIEAMHIDNTIQTYEGTVRLIRRSGEIHIEWLLYPVKREQIEDTDDGI